jgi:alcohol dehydrogenase (NADP+)
MRPLSRQYLASHPATDVLDEEQYCDAGQVGTYNGKYDDGSKSYGGYADYARHPGHFVIPIPDGLPSEVAAPMLCGGITVYHPLKVQGAGPGKKVGIIGIGGLGHFGLLFAKAMGAEVVAISTSERKKEDALKMGASKFIATDKGKSMFKENARTLDFIGNLIQEGRI